MTIKETNFIKIIAVITMVIDHIGVILFPNCEILRIIGRLAFPLFAYQITVSFIYTKSIKNYFARLLIFGLAMQIFYIIFEFLSVSKPQLGDLFYLNIFITLSIGVLCLYFYHKRNYISVLIIISLISLLSLFNITIDYGIYGIFSILLFHIFKNKPKLMVVSTIILTLIYVIISQDIIQLYALLSLVLILKPLSININLHKYFYYVFYPTHFIILYAISQFLL